MRGDRRRGERNQRGLVTRSGKATVRTEKRKPLDTSPGRTYPPRKEKEKDQGKKREKGDDQTPVSQEGRLSRLRRKRQGPGRHLRGTTRAFSPRRKKKGRKGQVGLGEERSIQEKGTEKLVAQKTESKHVFVVKVAPQEEEGKGYSEKRNGERTEGEDETHIER